MTPTVEVRNVIKNYKLENNDTIEILKDISFQINQGEFVAIIGPSGSGKSTLMHILGLLDTTTRGEILIYGRNVTKLTDKEQAKVRNQKIGFVFQSFNLLKKTKAIDNVILPLIYSNIPSHERTERAYKELEIVGLADKINNLPSQLSGGQQQRVAIARALVTQPSIILADEPTGNLDSKSGAQILQTFRELHQKGKTIIIVTHDPNVAAQTERILKIADGVLVSDQRNPSQPHTAEGNL